MPLLRTPGGHCLTLPLHRVSAGESAVNEIAIARGHGLAAVHFHLQPWESGHFLEDAGSGLGTMVNGRPVTWVPLKHGDIITAGSLTLVYELENGPPLPPLPGEKPAALATLKPAAESGARPAKPPSWLPPEALQPPVPPAAQASAFRHAANRERPPYGWWMMVLVLLLAAAATAWWMLWKR